MQATARIQWLVVLFLIFAVGKIQGQEHEHTQNVPPPPLRNFLSEEARNELKVLMVQDYQGRMKPLDTLCREMSWKIGKQAKINGWEPVDLFMSWLVSQNYWIDQPLLAVRNKQLKELLGINTELHKGKVHIMPSSLLMEDGRYQLESMVEKIHRTPNNARSKMQRKLLSLDDRFNLFFMSLRGQTLRIFPLPDDENNSWLSLQEVSPGLDTATQEEYQASYNELVAGLQWRDNDRIIAGARAIAAIQNKYGFRVIPSTIAIESELLLNKIEPFKNVIFPYLAAFLLLFGGYFWSLSRYRGAQYRFTHPLYIVGTMIYLVSIIIHLLGYSMRWIASSRAPLSNGYESLIFISLMVAVVSFYYEIRSRRGSIGGLGALLTLVILGIAMLPTFDPAISPLVPVLASFWLIIHVTVITASYGFLGLAAIMSMTILILHWFKSPGRETLRSAILDMSRLHWSVLVTGLAFLTVGTFLGGVWANESWGRYWGWDPKETWALVTILVYAFVVHLRFIDKTNKPWIIAAGSFVSISSVIMTYFGVNYFLSGLHSYAEGDVSSIPTWVYIGGVVMLLIILSSFVADKTRRWDEVT